MKLLPIVIAFSRLIFAGCETVQKVLREGLAIVIFYPTIPTESLPTRGQVRSTT